MRKGGSLSPKCSRYIESRSPAGGRGLFLLLRRFHAGVKRRAVDAEHLGCLADVTSRELHRRLDIALLPGFEHLVQIEASLALQMALRLFDQGSGFGGQSGPSLGLRLQVELGLELRE